MKRSAPNSSQPWKRYCSSEAVVIGAPKEEDHQTKQFYTGENGIIRLKEKIIAISDKKPRVLSPHALVSLHKNGVFLVQTKSSVLGPFFNTPSISDLPEGELCMIYECAGKYNKERTCCFLPVGLVQN